MDKESLLEIYDQEYAKGYDDQFLESPIWKVSADVELAVLGGVLGKETSWLDVGCGTGYFLSKFPDCRRAGLDLSPRMLEQAKERNPNVFFREGDFRIDIPEWHNQWDLVSCMWYPYSYVDSLGEFERVIGNLVSWAKPGGDVFLPVADLDDLRPELPHVPYEQYDPVTQGKIFITSYTWTWIQDNGVGNHMNMVAPHFEYVLSLMMPFFETIEVIRYPPVYEGWVSRKAILARRKRLSASQDDRAAEIVRHPVPPPANSCAPGQNSAANNNPAAMIGSKLLLVELMNRLKSGQLIKSAFKKVF